jgi:Ca2+-binding EF-hand superfamily protein
MKNLTRNILAAATLALVVAAPAAFADGLPGDTSRYVTMFDINKDGMISRVEVMKMAIEKFEKMADKQGMVDSKRAAQFLLDLQKSDGALPAAPMFKDDMLKMIGAMFDKVDTSKKGMLDRKQFELFLKELMKSAG